MKVGGGRVLILVTVVAAGAPGCGPETVALPEVGETRCFGEGGGPSQPFLPTVLGANGEPVHCVTEVNGYPTFSQDACFPDRMEAAGFEEAAGWQNDCSETPALIVPDARGWEEIRCWYLASLGDEPTGATCYARADDRWIFVQPPCTQDEILSDPAFFDQTVDQFCPAEDPATVPPDTFCFDEVDPDPDAAVHFRGCLQPVGKTWVSLFTSCTQDLWTDPVAESDACGG